jgi:ion channel POLLUX/CASTOR
VYEGIGTIDVVLRDNLISGALLQVSANTKLAGLFDFLLEKDGKELYMRPYDEFVTSNDGELTWGTLCERAREREEIAIGVVRAGGEFSMSPSKSSTFKLSIGDKIVVLAEDWWDAKSVNVKAQTAF